MSSFFTFGINEKTSRNLLPGPASRCANHRGSTNAVIIPDTNNELSTQSPALSVRSVVNEKFGSMSKTTG